MTIDIRPLTLPSSPDEPGPAGEAFRAAFAFHERYNTGRYGAGLYDNTAEEFLGRLASTPSERIEMLHAWEGERIVGALTVYSPLLDSTHMVEIAAEADHALDAATRREVAEALLARAHEELARAGRTTLIAGTPAAATGHVMAATGFGGADPALPEVAPLVERGYRLEQVYRISVADWSAMPDLDERFAAAAARAAGYDLVRWTGETPAEHRAAMCALHERMSTDAPIGGLALDPEVWDDARLTTFEQSMQVGGRVLLTVAARERATGDLAGFTTLILPSTGATARQHDTLVTKPHRGHGLGMLMKLDNLRRLRETRPELTRVVTWNAEENRPMLDVNEAAGFAPVGYEAEWQWQARA